VSRFPVTMGVTADGASPKGTVTANPLDMGSVTTVTLMTMKCGGSLKEMRQSIRYSDL
jgi:hypothetical protein